VLLDGVVLACAWEEPWQTGHPKGQAMLSLRAAQETDLARMYYDVFYPNEVRGSADPPPPGEIPPDLRHTLRTGTLCVAEIDGEVCAFAGAITRDRVVFLTDLFVRPDRQSSHLGKALLQHILPAGEQIRCTVSSSDLRALALYIRMGMQPQWPHFNLRLNGPLRMEGAATGIEIVPADPADPELARWDARISGRSRPLDHTYWVQSQQARPLWFRRHGATVGYGYVRLGAGTLWHPEACTIGPVGTATPDDAPGCVLAAVQWARDHAAVLRIDVPAAHPSLAPLLDAGAIITYVETFVSTARTPFFDPRCYIASGSTLF
jgi:GNAT superfamily N-acetyltransferase